MDTKNLKPGDRVKLKGFPIKRHNGVWLKVVWAEFGEPDFVFECANRFKIPVLGKTGVQGAERRYISVIDPGPANYGSVSILDGEFIHVNITGGFKTFKEFKRLPAKEGGLAAAFELAEDWLILGMHVKGYIWDDSLAEFLPKKAKELLEKEYGPEDEH